MCFHVLFDHLTGNVQGHGSGSKVTWVKIEGQVGLTRPKGHDIGRWAHVNVKLLHFHKGINIQSEIIKDYLSVLRGK